MKEIIIFFFKTTPAPMIVVTLTSLSTAPQGEAQALVDEQPALRLAVRCLSKQLPVNTILYKTITEQKRKHQTIT